MCNLYNLTKDPLAILDFTRAMLNEAGNLEPGDVYPDYSAPIVRNSAGGRVLARARWGLTSSRNALMDAASKRANKLCAKGIDVDFDHLPKTEPDSGTTNVRSSPASGCCDECAQGPRWASGSRPYGFLTRAQRCRYADPSEGDASDPQAA